MCGTTCPGCQQNNKSRPKIVLPWIFTHSTKIEQSEIWNAQRRHRNTKFSAIWDMSSTDLSQYSSMLKETKPTRGKYKWDGLMEAITKEFNIKSEKSVKIFKKTNRLSNCTDLWQCLNWKLYTSLCLRDEFTTRAPVNIVWAIKHRILWITFLHWLTLIPLSFCTFTTAKCLQHLIESFELACPWLREELWNIAAQQFWNSKTKKKEKELQ